MENPYRYKKSRQRAKIIEIIQGSQGHFTAEDIYDRLKKEFSRLSLGTVYRNLRVLKEQGIITGFTLKNVDHFDTNTSPHYHFICKVCSRIYDVPIPRDKGFKDKISSAVPYDVEDLKMEFYGSCSKCKGGEGALNLSLPPGEDSIRGGIMAMKEIRIHGRGGQGVVTAADLLAVAAFYDGRYAQAFPSFGSERMGAPVEAYVKISETKVRSKIQVHNPDYLIIQDPTLFLGVDVLKGLKEGGLVIVNTDKKSEDLHIKRNGFKVLTIPATDIALEILKRPIPNTTLLGALAGATGVVSLDAIERSIKERFSGELAEKNLRAVEVAYKRVKG